MQQERLKEKGWRRWGKGYGDPEFEGWKERVRQPLSLRHPFCLFISGQSRQEEGPSQPVMPLPGPRRQVYGAVGIGVPHTPPPSRSQGTSAHPDPQLVLSALPSPGIPPPAGPPGSIHTRLAPHVPQGLSVGGTDHYTSRSLRLGFLVLSYLAGPDMQKCPLLFHIC